MNVKLLIDGIVRQTTVLIAQLSTASGVRAPLAHVADRVFLDLSREIEAQGVRRQVAADMFGMALRSYQKKTQRLTESATSVQRTLWEAVLELVEHEQPSRERILERFSRDGEREVAAVLNDLVRSGLVYVTGTGAGAVYGVTNEAARDKVQRQHDLDSIANLTWLRVFRGEGRTREELGKLLNVEPELLEAAIDELIASGRLQETEGELESSNLVLPLGADQGWEAAVLDHFCTVAVAIATKIRCGLGASAEADRIGGSTFTFTLGPNHPHAETVYGLLRKTRLEAQTLWDEVARYNEAHPPDPQHAVKVSFYVGQTTQQDESQSEEFES
jgi:hypothetical protein